MYKTYYFSRIFGKNLRGAYYTRKVFTVIICVSKVLISRFFRPKVWEAFYTRKLLTYLCIKGIFRFFSQRFRVHIYRKNFYRIYLYIRGIIFQRLSAQNSVVRIIHGNFITINIYVWGIIFPEFPAKLFWVRIIHENYLL